MLQVLAAIAASAAQAKTGIAQQEGKERDRKQKEEKVPLSRARALSLSLSRSLSLALSLSRARALSRSVLVVKNPLYFYVSLSAYSLLRAEDAQGTPTQSHISPSILVYEHSSGFRAQETRQSEPFSRRNNISILFQ